MTSYFWVCAVEQESSGELRATPTVHSATAGYSRDPRKRLRSCLVSLRKWLDPGAGVSSWQPTAARGKSVQGSSPAERRRCFCLCRREKTTCRPARNPSEHRGPPHKDSPNCFFPARHHRDRAHVRPLG